MLLVLAVKEMLLEIKPLITVTLLSVESLNWEDFRNIIFIFFKTLFQLVSDSSCPLRKIKLPRILILFSPNLNPAFSVYSLRFG